VTKQPMPSAIREMPPCHDCTEKFLACHGNCPKDKRGEFGYDAWLAELQRIKKNRKAYDSLNRRKTWQRKTSWIE
jgi:hypothetical protein